MNKNWIDKFNLTFITIFIALLAIVSHYLPSQEYKLSACAIFQDEAPYLKEWIDYHLKAGVEHFWLYDNNSQDDFSEVLAPYIEDDLIDLIPWESTPNDNDFMHFSFDVQTSAYNDAIHRARGVSKWLAIIDIDEYIVPVCNPTIIDALETYFSNASGVLVNWQCYGTSHVTRCNTGEMLKNLTYKMRWNHPRNYYYKSIVQPLHVTHCANPHYCLFLPGHWQINTNYDAILQDNTGVYIDKLRINHYWTKDEWFFWNVKIPRHKKWGADEASLRDASNQMNEEYDPILSDSSC